MQELHATTSMSSKEICEQQLGYTPGQIRGRSATKKQAAEIEHFKSQIEENKRRANAAEERAATLFEQFTAQQKVIQNLEQQQMETKELYLQLLAKMNELSR